ncbi:hypothetical protein [Palleronia caenipelagi]|uniref:Uncharacterized protein n=1 Tax=Palleronia caenipelagi TaxID=2489174 RepID=A0A547PS26_9RHOB|nr:hypothetical protein [Palleronia caenipelagi]TRD16949.1 hypothetical protein FEV53_13515 [Palleronia caenipelagi]
MARDQEHVPVGKDWTELTNAEASTVSFQVVAGQVEIRAAGAQPLEEDQGLRYDYGQGEWARVMMEYSGGHARLWARNLHGAGSSTVWVDHA